MGTILIISYFFQPQLPQKLIMPFRTGFYGLINCNQLSFYLFKVDLDFVFGGAYIAGDVEVEAVLFDFLHGNFAGIAVCFLSLLIGFYYVGDMFFT